MRELPPPHIRPATVADAAALSELARRTFVDTFAPHNDPADMAAFVAATYDTEIQRAELADATRPCLVAERDGALVAFAQLRHGEPPACVSDRSAIEIQRFYLDRPAQGTGLARTLMQACLTLARARGATSVYLGVWEHNARALRFYAAQGYLTVGAQEFRLGRDVQRDLILTRSLADVVAG